MAFPTGWLRKCKLTIQNAKIDDTLSNFPVLITETTLPQGNDEIFDADGVHPAQNGGGDIRFSSDSAGSSQLACEIVTFTTDNTPANGKAEIWVEVPSISSSVDTDIYIWWETSGSDSQPAEDATYGKEDTWDDGGSDYFKMVQHLNEDPTPNGAQAIDSTQYDTDGTSAGTMDSDDLVTGAFQGGTQGKAWDFDRNSDQYIDCGNPNALNVDYVSVSFFAKATDWNLTNLGLFSKGGSDTADRQYWMWANYNTLYSAIDGEQYAELGSAPSANEWHHFVLTYDGEDVSLYIDGVYDSGYERTTGPIVQTSYPLYIGYINAYDHFDGSIDEVRISATPRPVAWITTEYENQSDPNTFIVEGAPEVAVGAVAPTAALYGPLVGPMGGPI